MYKIKFTLGDWSGDGHGLHKDYYLQSNYSAQSIENAYSKTIDILGFDFIKECCSDYNDNYINPEYSKILVEQGVLNRDYLIKEGAFKGYCFIDTPDDYLDLLFKVIRLAIPDFTWKNATKDYEELSFGDNLVGYGVFYD